VEPYRPPYLAAALAAAGVFVLYVITLSPTTAFWDTSEYIATATIMGIPHPPGNPLFVVLARAWDLLLEPLGLSTAVRINLFSALMSALAHGCWFLLADRILSFYSTDRVVPPDRRERGRADQRDRVHRMEPVEREREGLHGHAVHDRAAVVARVPLARPSGRGQG
jgi:hypothetical protein